MARKVKENRFVLIFTFTDGDIGCRADYILTSTDSIDGDLDKNKSCGVALTQGQMQQITLTKNQIFAGIKATEEA